MISRELLPVCEFFSFYRIYIQPLSLSLSHTQVRDWHSQHSSCIHSLSFYCAASHVHSPFSRLLYSFAFSFARSRSFASARRLASDDNEKAMRKTEDIRFHALVYIIPLCKHICACYATHVLFFFFFF